jgi:septum formation protein
MLGKLIYRRLIRPIVTAYGSPHAVAMGIAIGVFLALVPCIGLQMLLAYVLALLLRANRVIPVALVWSNTFVIVPLFWFDHFLGSRILGGDPITIDSIRTSFAPIYWYNWWEVFDIIGFKIYGPMLLGGAVFGLTVAIPLYFALLWAFKSAAGKRKIKLAEAAKDLKILLASASERRQKLLKEAGYNFEILVPDIDETVNPHMSPRKNAMRIARLKARAAAERSDADIVIAADTLTALNREIIGKPADAEDAKSILRKSSGRRSSVVTAVCIIDRRRNKTICRADEAIVKMRKLTDAEIDAYVASGEAMDKAGAYAIREKNDPFVKSVVGDVDTVVGFPRNMFEHMLYRLLFGVIPRKRRPARQKR